MSTTTVHPPIESAEHGAQGVTPGFSNAAQFAFANETGWSRNLDRGLAADNSTKEPAPWNEVLGPTRDRALPHGLIIHRGERVAHWGDIGRADMTFSVTKSFLGLLTAIALDDGLIGSIDDKAADYALDDSFTSAQNESITWRHLLEQTSEWHGTLWSKPDQVDHFRAVGGGDNSRKGELRALQRPGAYWEYNDVRVNRLSHLLLEVFKRPLPEVLGDRIMAPIGASDTWSWNAYHNAWLDLDGSRLASVPGGGHWGGGLFINSEDLARVAGLVKASGRSGTEQIITPESIDLLLEPAALNPVYGKLWWLNTECKYYPSAPPSSFFAVGAGTNLVWIDRELDLVAVARWISPKAIDAFLGHVLAGIEPA